MQWAGDLGDRLQSRNERGADVIKRCRSTHEPSLILSTGIHRETVRAGVLSAATLPCDPNAGRQGDAFTTGCYYYRGACSAMLPRLSPSKVNAPIGRKGRNEGTREATRRLLPPQSVYQSTPEMPKRRVKKKRKLESASSEPPQVFKLETLT